MEQLETVIITKDHYDALVEAQAFLDCLEACGVDNWQGYDDACNMYNEEEDAE